MQLIRAIILVEVVAAVLLSRNAGAQTTRELNTIADIYAATRACWKAPNISDPLELAKFGSVLPAMAKYLARRALHMKTKLFPSKTDFAFA